MGLLISAEMANAYLFDDTYVARITREWIEAVEADYSHPSISRWVPLNEGWGVPSAADARQRPHVRDRYKRTRSLGPTRLVIDNDPCDHPGCTDLMPLHDYSRSGDRLCA